MTDPEFYKKGPEIATVTARLEEVDRQLAETYARWEELERLQ
jgi:hypothetical protein